MRRTWAIRASLRGSTRIIPVVQVLYRERRVIAALVLVVVALLRGVVVVEGVQVVVPGALLAGEGLEGVVAAEVVGLEDAAEEEAVVGVVVEEGDVERVWIMRGGK